MDFFNLVWTSSIHFPQICHKKRRNWSFFYCIALWKNKRYCSVKLKFKVRLWRWKSSINNPSQSSFWHPFSPLKHNSPPSSDGCACAWKGAEQLRMSPNHLRNLLNHLETSRLTHEPGCLCAWKRNLPEHKHIRIVLSLSTNNSVCLLEWCLFVWYLYRRSVLLLTCTNLQGDQRGGRDLEIKYYVKWVKNLDNNMTTSNILRWQKSVLICKDFWSKVSVGWFSVCYGHLICISKVYF